MQSFRYDTTHMRHYELGHKPVNSIWINYYHLKKYLINKKINYYPLNLNAMGKIPRPIKERKYDVCLCIFNDPNGWKTGVDNMPMITKLRSLQSCPFYLFIEVLDDASYNLYSNYFNKIFTNRNHVYPNSISLGFAANHELLIPMKDSTKIRILIDHPAYTQDHFDRKDKTKDILQQIWNFKFPKPVIIRRFINGTIETTNKNNYKIELYKRKGVNILTAFEEYNRTDIFFVTHPESMGMSVIESAMAGALIVTPRSYIKSEFLLGLEYIEFDKVIDWNLVLSKMNTKVCRRQALAKTWVKLYDKLFRSL